MMGLKKTIDLTEWVETYTSELYSWAFYKVSDAELAKDLVQDTFLVAAEKIETFKGKSTPKTWLFSILNYKVIDVYRNRVKQPISMDSHIFSNFFDGDGSWHLNKRPQDWQEDEQHLLDDAGFQNILKRCLDALPDKWNTAVKLKYLTGKNGEEICQELRIASTNLWQIIHRAKLQLRDCIEDNWLNK